MRSAVYGISKLGAVIAQRAEVAHVFEPDELSLTSRLACD